MEKGEESLITNTVTATATDDTLLSITGTSVSTPLIPTNCTQTLDETEITPTTTNITSTTPTITSTATTTTLTSSLSTTTTTTTETTDIISAITDKQFSDSEIKTIINDSYLKVNGDHQNDKNQSFLDCEESCASTASSSSSRNLIIDHPEDSQEDGINVNSTKLLITNNNDKKNITLQKNDNNDELIENQNSDKLKIESSNSMKRKLSIDCNKENYNKEFSHRHKIARLEENEHNNLELSKDEKQENLIRVNALDGDLLEAAAFKYSNTTSILEQQLLLSQEHHGQKQVQQENEFHTSNASTTDAIDLPLSSSQITTDINLSCENEMTNVADQLRTVEENNMKNEQNKINNNNNIEQQGQQQHQQQQINKEHFQGYAQYLGIKPSIKYKCFKCLNFSYDTMNELRDHQKICLFKKSTNQHSKERKMNNVGSNNNNKIDEIFSNSSSRFIDLQQEQLLSQSNYNNQTKIPFSSVTTTATTITSNTINLNNFKETIQNSLDSTKKLPQIHQKRIFLCSACGTYYERWNLFLHMREVHKRLVCLYCFGMFPNAERLTLHLEMKHDIEQNHFDTQENFLKSSKDICYLMCCTCENVFTEHENFSDHNCSDFIKPCSICGGGQNGKHNIDCKYASVTSSLSSSTLGKQKKERLQRKNKTHEIKNKKLLSINDKRKQQINTQNLNTNQIISDSHKNNINNNNSNNNSVSGNGENEILGNILTNIICDNFNENKQHQQQHLKLQQPQQQQQQHHENSYHNIKLNGCVADPTIITAINNTSVYPSNPLFLSNSIPSTPTIGQNDCNSLITTRSLLNQQQQQHERLAFTSNNFKYNQNTFELDKNIQNECQINNQMFAANNFSTYDSNSNQIQDNTDMQDNSSYITENLSNQMEKQKSFIDNANESNAIIAQKTIQQNSNEINTVNFDDIPKVQDNVEEKRLVPKFKLKIPKNYQITAPIESDQSTSGTETEDNNTDEENENETESGIQNNYDLKTTEDDGTNENVSLQSKTFSEINNDNVDNVNNNMNEDNYGSNNQNREDFEEEKSNNEESNNVFDNFVQQQTVSPVNDASQEMSNENHQSLLLPTSPFPKDDVEEKEEKSKPLDGIELADDSIPIIELSLSQPLDKIEMIEFLRICLQATFPFCLYCNYARRIAVNGYSFALHLLGQHRFSATVDSITAEELLPTTIVTKLKSFLSDLNDYYFNLETYCNMNERKLSNYYDKIFECFQCRFETRIHKELYLHNRKLHLRTAILCFMCKSNFFNYSEILCHMCPGEANKCIIFDIQFRCCLCDLDKIPSAFRLMVHLRKAHSACDVCLEDCQNQSKLSSHVWKHKLHHLCYRCGIAYRNKSDITKHLFWKHGTESVLCKRCLQKRWPHVYHFCIPPLSFVCEICNLSFSKAMYLKVHKRLHSGDAPYPCTEDNCDQKFISRKLLLKHLSKHAEEIEQQKLQQTAIIGRKSQEKEENTTEVALKEDAEKDLTAVETTDKDSLCKENSTEIMNKVSDITTENETQLNKREKKKKKQKKESNKTTLEDEIMKLPAPNLSESDSSDDEEQGKEKIVDSSCTSPPPPSQSPLLSSSSPPIVDVPKVMLSPQSDAADNDDDDKDNAINHAPVIDIWENFKAFQASQQANKINKEDDDDDEDNNLKPIITPILHVVQSDHDYCMIYYNLIVDKKDNEEKLNEDVLNKNENENVEKEVENLSVKDKSLEVNEEQKKERTDSEKVNTTDSSSITSPKKKQKQQKERTKSGSDSSSDSSSSSGSSCSCGSNCSCSSSSSSSSGSSSSSEDSDSSTSEGKRRIAAKRAAKEEKRKRNKSENSSKANNSDVIDVVTADAIDVENPVVEVPKTLESFIQETDLETDESDTDEDFYDEHPQKLATQMLAEKRKQLMMQTCMSPLNNFDIVENSRPSTPSLPEEMMKEKKVKIKKKKRERKTQKNNVSNTILSFGVQHNISSVQQNDLQQHSHQDTNIPNPNVISTTLLGPPTMIDVSSAKLTPTPVQISTPIPAPITSIQSRLSTGSNSDAETPLKRSKRTRRPNRFYGYSSDDESIASANYLTGPAAFKPIPPPNFTWRKEDLPTPSKSKNTKSSHSRKSIHSLGGNKAIADGSSAMPPIPPIIIRPKSISSTPKPPVIDHNVPLVEPLRIPIPPVAVHHIQPAQIYSSSGSKESQESDSSDEDRLHIPVTQPQHSGRRRKPKSGATQAKASGLNFQMTSTPFQSTSVPTLLPSPILFQQATPSLLPPPPPPTAPPAAPRERKIPPALLSTPPDFERIQYFRRNNIRYPIRPPPGARPPREGESIYCYCRCPYDEVSEMIACDGEDCLIEWFHFECVGILVPPTGKWFCPECRQLYSNEMPQQQQQQQSEYNTFGNNMNNENGDNNYQSMMMTT